MVKLKFIVKDGVLVLRISESRQRFYKRVGYLLKGTPNLERHWKADKERFSSYSNFHGENNQALEEFKQIYWKVIQQHPELSARQVADYYKSADPEPVHHTGDDLVEWNINEYKNSVHKYLEIVILRERAKQGCNYEPYYKLLNRCISDIPGFKTMAFSSVDYNRMVGIAYIFANRKGYRNMGKTFRAFLGKAHKDKDVEFNLKQIGDFKFADYNPDRHVVVEKHPDILTDDQLRLFLNMSVADMTPTYKDRQQVELYYDFCVFMFHSFFAPCDVIKTKRRDITRKNTIVIKRKKTHRTVEVPVTPVMREIIDKYRGQSKDGYIFPIMDDEADKKYTTKDYCFKKFREKLNVWLKEVGKELGTDFDMYAYVFRHTAITVALNNSLPISYVANAAGTSIEMIQAHYYNGESEKNRDMLTSAFMRAAV